MEWQVLTHKITAKPYKQKDRLSLLVSPKFKREDINTADLSGESIFAKDGGTCEEWAK